MRKKACCFSILAGMLLCLLTGCTSRDVLNPNDPVTLALWHTYVEQMKVGMEELVDEFNNTLGAQNGIVIVTTSVANASVLNEKLIMAANGDPGSPEFPDLAVIYPNVAVELAEKGLLMDISSQFDEAELSRYVPEFLEEGKLAGDTLYLLPIAKSTEVLYVNKTIFDRFAADTGVTISQLATFEGILDAAEKYYIWTDMKTPGVPDDGKAFFYPESLTNYSMVGFRQLGYDFVTDGRLNLSGPAFQKIWDSYYPGAVKGSVMIFDSYGNYLAMTGDIVCNTGTSAGVIYYPKNVTYDDNTKENVEFIILPYPVFEGGKKVAMQRGGGMCVFKSEARKEYAAGIFMKWLTEPEQNLRFTSLTGYLPVTTDAFESYMAQEIENIENESIKKLMATVVEMHEEYEFFVSPVFNGFEELQTEYEQGLRKAAEKSRQEYQAEISADTPKTTYEAVSKGAAEKFIEKHQ